jgi:heptosyltransferase-3
MQLRTKSKVAVVTARGLGDGLLSLILSQNLLCSGYHVTTFSTILCQMREWFPEHQIAPFDTYDPAAFDYIFAADHSLVRKSDEKTTILYEKDFDKRRSMVENLAAFAKKWELPGTTETGVQIPHGLLHRKEKKRIVIHPMSADIRKNWHPERFRSLADKLKHLGYEAVLCVSPQEKTLWPEARAFETISDLAAFIYESGYLIGNDSGLGHLASLLKVPTLSLFARKSYSRLWKPDFSTGRVVTPSIPLIGAPMKQKHWKNFLTVSTVLKNFRYLVKTS